MKYKIVNHPNITGCYGIMYKKKWWHRWKFVHRPATDAVPDGDLYKSVWYTIKGCQAYINQELIRHGITSTEKADK